MRVWTSDGKVHRFEYPEYSCDFEHERVDDELRIFSIHKGKRRLFTTFPICNVVRWP